MGSSTRLRKICSIIQESYVELTHQDASTLFINYPQVQNLLELRLPNKSYYSNLKRPLLEAEELGLETISHFTKQYNIIIISIPKSREEALGQVALACQNVKPGGLVIIEGNKRHGIDNIIKTLSQIVTLQNLTSKAHGKIGVIKVSSEKFTGFSRWLDYISPTKNNDGFLSMPGLFSYKKADLASKFLASNFDKQIDGNVVDLGAGWGFLSIKLLENCPQIKSVTLVDHDKRAIDCAKINVKSTKATFEWLDINETNTLGIKFDNAICNPPFHSNTRKNIELGKNFIKIAFSNLKNTGNLLMVANIQLPYEKLVSSLFQDCRIHSHNKYFKIILAKRPKRSYNEKLAKI
tara:strand:- start:658 stop:1707 length:1050 start_codon:yes stop_codon:yes gene_type:complete